MIAFVFAFRRPDGKWGVVNDAHRRLILTKDVEVAQTFAAALRKRTSGRIVPVRQDAEQIAQLVMSANVAAEQVGAHIVSIESDTPDKVDALFKAGEMAATVPLDTPGDWRAAHTEKAEA